MLFFHGQGLNLFCQTFSKSLAPGRANEAERMGYVSRVFPTGELLPQVMDIARTMATYDRTCLSETKMLANIIVDEDLDGAMKQQEWLFRSYIGSEDNHRRIDALLAKLKKK